MDTTTVLEIIKMIGGRLFNLQCEYDAKVISEQTYYISRKELLLFRDYLQEYIEQRVSAMEQSTPE